MIARLNARHPHEEARYGSARADRLHARVVDLLKTMRQSVPHLAEYEFMERACEGLEPSEQKTLVMVARDPAVRLISDETAEMLIQGLGLMEA